MAKDSIKSIVGNLTSIVVAAITVTLLLGFGTLMLYHFNQSANGTITQSVNFLNQNTGLIAAVITMLFIAVMIQPMITVISKLKSIFSSEKEE